MAAPDGCLGGLGRLLSPRRRGDAPAAPATADDDDLPATLPSADPLGLDGAELTRRLTSAGVEPIEAPAPLVKYVSRRLDLDGPLPEPAAGAPPHEAAPAAPFAAAPDGERRTFGWTPSRKVLEAAILAEQAGAPLGGARRRRLSSRVAAFFDDDVAAAERRLAGRLRRLGLTNHVVPGDGNCQFSALALGLHGDAARHADVRAAAVAHMAGRRADFEPFVGEDWGRYLGAMALPGTWGDELTLRAAADAHAAVVNVFTDAPGDHWFVRHTPSAAAAGAAGAAGAGGGVAHEVFLSYVSPVHYNAVRRAPGGGLPALPSTLLGRRRSAIHAALLAYERERRVPADPRQVLEDADAGAAAAER